MEFKMEKNLKILGIHENMQEQIDALSPYNQLNQKEFDAIITKIGSFLYLTHNKNINPTNLFLYIMTDKEVQALIIELTSCPSLITILKCILNRYPNLIKSKMLKSKATHINKQHKKKNHVIK
jgi:hypothetical protein